jgi:hypothetical protein
MREQDARDDAADDDAGDPDPKPRALEHTSVVMRFRTFARVERLSERHGGTRGFSRRGN